MVCVGNAKAMAVFDGSNPGVLLTHEVPAAQGPPQPRSQELLTKEISVKMRKQRKTAGLLLLSGGVFGKS